MPSGNYKEMAQLVDDWLALNRSPGFTFQPEDIFKHYSKEIFSKNQKNDIMEKLWYEVNKKGNLEKNGRLYKYIIRDKRIIPWYNVDSNNTISIRWPCSHLDATEFDFGSHLIVSQGDLIVVAGVSNMGKTAFMQNFLFENMDTHPCQMMINEYNPGKFKRRIMKMDWAKPLKDDGTPKFQLIERHEDWKYAIEPDWINIIDWINVADGDFWKIGTLMEGIKGKLSKGIALVVIQKNESKDIGTGGQFSEHMADDYFLLDFQRLTVRKVKEHDNSMQPNGKVYGFEIIDGVHFSVIRQLRPCPKCHSRCLINKIECETCHSAGWIDKGVSNV